MGGLAQVTDLSARLGRDLTTEEQARASYMLDDASALVRSFTGRTFDYVVGDMLTTRCEGGEIRLPQRPVVEVTSVEAAGSSSGFVAITDYVFDGIDLIRLGSQASVVNMPEWWFDDLRDGFPHTYTVTYTHGFLEIPAAVVAVVCRIVLRSLTSPSLAGGVVSETIGPVSYRVDSAGGGLSVSLGPDDKALLAPFKNGSAGSIMVRHL